MSIGFSGSKSALGATVGTKGGGGAGGGGGGGARAVFSGGYNADGTPGSTVTIDAEANGGYGYDGITMEVSGTITATMYMWGAGGGGTKRSGGQTGGGGGYSTGSYTFQPGTYRVVVGGAGEGGSQSPSPNNEYRAISDFISGMTDRYAINLNKNFK